MPRLLTIKQVREQVGLSRTKIYELLAERKFPQPTYPAPRAPRWRSDEIATWIEEVSDARVA